MGLFHAYIYVYIYIGALGTHPHLGATRPRVGIAKLGFDAQLGNKKMYCICLSRHRALTSKCRRGDASPPGEDALPAGKDTLHSVKRAPYARVHNIYLETFFLVPCFIFIT